MTDQDPGAPTAKTTVPEALTQWRDAERTVAVARKGKQAAAAAAAAAAEAAEAAVATEAAAKRSLEAATLAETSAIKTARAARLAAASTGADAADADTELALAEASEGLAKHYYGEAVAKRKTKESS